MIDYFAEGIDPNAPIFELPTFKVGDRVRVTAGIAECGFIATHFDIDSGEITNREVRGHLFEEFGAVGEITSIKEGEDPAVYVDAHPYVVAFEHDIANDKYGVFGGSIFCAAELELLTDEMPS